MDFWASLEHQLRYKTKNELTDDLHGRLKNCAEKTAALDMEMQDIYYAKISKANVQNNKML
jgi:putative GTP pyrophosphokinase